MAGAFDDGHLERFRNEFIFFISHSSSENFTMVFLAAKLMFALLDGYGKKASRAGKWKEMNSGMKKRKDRINANMTFIIGRRLDEVKS